MDYSEDLHRINRPTLIIHGDDDQIVPIQASAHLAAKLLPDATLNLYTAGPHGIAEIEAARFNADVLKFTKT